MNLEDLRRKIDEIDAQIVELIGRRAEIAEEIGREKRAVGKLIEDRERENQVLENIKSVARERRVSISEEDIESIYWRIIAACKSIEGIEVAFQGEVGAYSEEAAFQFFGSSIQIRPRETLEEVFRAVEEEGVQFGVVPVENSLEGSISRVYDLLLDSALRVCGETELRVIHCLIAGPDAGLDTVRKVYSHPQALAQCRSFLKHLNAELIPTYDTAGSVKMIREKGLADSAAIASARAAEIYGMKIIAQGIEDNPNNFTRFFLLSREDAPPSGNDKTSIVFSTKDRPGALYQALGEFARRNLNLTKLESRPTRQKPWQYNFYLDFEGHRQDEPAREALESLEEISIFVKVLGSYPKAKKTR
ncbi:MAG TPA: prephenate dehydratase [Dehalococcoidia bacterium]|jgi:chorismate mutase/prephenate dehydratase|nr:prephenate dehydratase [Dehalococcoidia bacterium]